VLEICKKYFLEVSENSFDGTISELKELVELECKRQWKNYLGRYELKVDIKSLQARKFSFSCYATLEENKRIVARAYGGVRNYSLLKAYLDNFIGNLESVTTDLDPNLSKKEPPDIAFIIAPDCSTFLQKTLESKKIAWVDSSHRLNTTEIVNIEEESIKDVVLQNKEIVSEAKNIVDINIDERSALKTVFHSTGIGEKLIDEIIEKRPYKNLRDLKEKVKGIASKREQIIQSKIDASQISFKLYQFNVKLHRKGLLG
jgi:hypothetical protein